MFVCLRQHIETMRVVQKSEIRAYRIPIWRSPIDNSIGMRLWVRNGLFRRGWLSIIRNFSAHCAAFCAITKLKSKQMHQDQTRHKFANSKTIYIQTSHTEYPLLQLTQNHSAFSLGLFNTCLVRRFCKWTKMQKKKTIEILFLIGVCTFASCSLSRLKPCAVNSAVNI